MKQVKLLDPTIMLRRFNGECLELSFDDRQDSSGQRPAPALCRVAVQQDGGAQVYVVTLPKNVTVLPVDWRRFAYDHAKVREFLGLCIQDNVGLHGLERGSDEQETFQTDIALALGDLRSIFDVSAVRCERDVENMLRISIEGTHKNGELINLVVPCHLL